MPLIRAVEPGDLDALYEVCLRTGDAGADGTSLFKDPRLLGEVYVGPYLSVRGGLGFTAVDDDGPAGYALAAVDSRRFETECEEEWWPALRARYPDPGPDPVTPDEEVIAVITGRTAPWMRWWPGSRPIFTSISCPVSRGEEWAGS